MLSIITTEASTTIPTPRIKPVSVIIFSVIPAKFMHRTVIIIESGTETTTELEGDLDTNALVLKSTEEKTEEDAEEYSLFDTDTMRLYLLDDGKLCFTSADSMDDAEKTDEAVDDENSEGSEDSIDSMDWTVKVFFDKLEKK